MGGHVPERSSDFMLVLLLLFLRSSFLGLLLLIGQLKDWTGNWGDHAVKGHRVESPQTL